MFIKRSKVLFSCALLASVYVLYLLSYFGSASSASDSSEALGKAFATVLVAPHMFMIGLGAIFSWLGFFLRKGWAALTGAILYCVGAFVFIPYALLVVPLIILGFVGFTQQNRLMLRSY